MKGENVQPRECQRENGTPYREGAAVGEDGSGDRGLW